MPCRERGIQSSDAIEPGDAHVNALKRPPSTSRHRPLDPYKHAGRTPEWVPVENMQQMQYAAFAPLRREEAFLADTHKVPGLLLAIAFRLRQDGIGWSNRNCSMTHAEPQYGEDFE